MAHQVTSLGMSVPALLRERPMHGGNRPERTTYELTA
jgi:hypothetical protein